MIHRRPREKTEGIPRTAAGNIPLGIQAARTFRNEVPRQKRAAERALLARTHFEFIVYAVKHLSSDANFLTLLRAEAMQTAPALIWGPVNREEGQEDAGLAEELPACGAAEEPNEVDLDSAIKDLKRGNLTSIREHYVIRRLISSGVSTKQIAGALGVSVEYAHFKGRLLDEISPEVVNLFKDRRITPHVFDVLRSMTEKRQIEVANLMIAAGNQSYRYARGLQAATRPSDLVRSKRISGLTPKKMGLMERQMGKIQSAILSVERTYSDDMLNLTIAKGYIAKLTSNSEIEHYLEDNHPKILDGFRGILAPASLV